MALSIEEYERTFGPEPGWEYADGNAIRKPVPTFLHGLLSILLAELLRQAGYFSSVEADLHLPDWSPRPDACGVLTPVEGKYPSAPVDVVFEVLSEGEKIEEKCLRYSLAGISQIFVFNPESRRIWRWDEAGKLIPVVDVSLSVGVTITGLTIWSEMERRHKERDEPPVSKRI